MSLNFKKRLPRMVRMTRHQKGAVTMFSAVLILILLTEVILYSTQVGVFEQRKSANDERQKMAFHAAEAGISHAKEFFLANALELSYAGTPGWLESGSERWQLCPGDPAPGHPCSGEVLKDLPEIYGSTYFYSPVDDDIAVDSDPTLLPIDTNTILALGDLNERVEVQALLCILDIDRLRDPVVQGCTTTPKQYEHIYFLVTLLARGQADCEDPADSTTCKSEALIAAKVGSFGPGAGDGGPGVPLTTRSNFPPGGTAEIVPNPNGGGVGVPISAWINGRPDGSLCPQQEEPVDATGGSWSTCEAQEWYGVNSLPEDFACPTSQCSCGAQERRISYTDNIGMDIVVDPAFPCDLFYATFGEVKSEENFWKLAASIGRVIDSCDDLDAESKGVYWMVGDTCSINANTVIGSAEFPVFLVSAAGLTRLNGGAEFWGILYVSDALRNDATFESGGTNTIYGAVVVDAELGSYTGTFQIVYIDAVVSLAANSPGIGNVAGGWTDFHRFWR